ncbi:MAG: phosphoribosylanthranilate isomerase [Gammaproteobacteria bacterium]|nr:phosphoribosylanthranilate isomerase [Gammaproteobacteria bacterium]
MPAPDREARCGRTRIKFCGITRAQDALAACALGVDALGFVFYAPSRRAVSAPAAATIVARLPPFVTTVGVFVDPQATEVEAVLAQVALNVLQFHGDEPQALCDRFGLPWVKAVRMAPGVDPAVVLRSYPGARAVLLDSWDPDRHGGTGAVFDWTRIPAALARPLVLAGGLTPANVARACALVRPFAVDVSGGIEAAPGVKDLSRMRAFVEELRRYDSTRDSG